MCGNNPKNRDIKLEARAMTKRKGTLKEIKVEARVTLREKV